VALFTIAPDPIVEGSAATLRWDVKNVVNVEIEPNLGRVAAAGETEVRPLTDTRFVLTAKGPGGETTGIATIRVKQKPTNPGVIAQGRRLYEEGVAKSLASSRAALSLFRQAAELGETRAMVALAERDLEGDSSEKQQALQWFRRAADLGNTGAMRDLGAMYYMGEGVPEDFERAAFWWRRGAEGGEPSCMYNFGRLYENGRGVVKDMTRAVELYRQSAALGNSSASHRLKQLELPGK
jgi:TPR repeat protein